MQNNTLRKLFTDWIKTLPPKNQEKELKIAKRNLARIRAHVANLPAKTE